MAQMVFDEAGRLNVRLGWALPPPAFCRLLLRLDARLVKGDDVALRDLIPALKPHRYDTNTADHNLLPV